MPLPPLSPLPLIPRPLTSLESPLPQAAIAKAIGAVQIAVAAFALAGDTVAQHLGVALPDRLLRPIQEQRFAVCVGALLVGNMLRSPLIATGAFEVHYGPTLIFSKLNTGAMFRSIEDLLMTVQDAISASQ
jgi:hypothetical protein